MLLASAVSLTACAALLAMAECAGRDVSAKDAVNSRASRSADAVGGQGAASTSDAVDAQPANPDPCSFIPHADATRLLGPFGASFRGKSADDPSPSADGRACVYPLAPRENVAEGSVIALELKTSGAMGFENGGAVTTGIAKEMFKDLGVKSGDGAQHNVDGWDYVGGYTDVVTARVGHIAVYAKFTRARGAADSLVRVMDIMRDRIPDRPFLSDERGSTRDEGDACSLLTREEVETVVGKLVVPPYHSRDLTGLADPHGNACTYYTPNHHVLSFMPSWRAGKALFRVLGGLSTMVDSKVGSAGERLETVVGDWDQVAPSVTGDRMFLKGDRLLQVSYRMSTNDQGGVMHLASIAVKRLAAAP